MYQICFYVPASHLEQVKAALFEEGAGRLGHYDSCCWETEGRGQFRPLPGSQPYVGERDRIERVVEYKVEMICQARYLTAALRRLLAEHPYETPAYHAYRIEMLAGGLLGE